MNMLKRIVGESINFKDLLYLINYSYKQIIIDFGNLNEITKYCNQYGIFNIYTLNDLKQNVPIFTSNINILKDSRINSQLIYLLSNKYYTKYTDHASFSKFNYISNYRFLFEKYFVYLYQRIDYDVERMHADMNIQHLTCKYDSSIFNVEMDVLNFIIDICDNRQNLTRINLYRQIINSIYNTRTNIFNIKAKIKNDFIEIERDNKYYYIYNYFDESNPNYFIQKLIYYFYLDGIIFYNALREYSVKYIFSNVCFDNVSKSVPINFPFIKSGDYEFYYIVLNSTITLLKYILNYCKNNIAKWMITYYVTIYDEFDNIENYIDHVGYKIDEGMIYIHNTQNIYIATKKIIVFSNLPRKFMNKLISTTDVSKYKLTPLNPLVKRPISLSLVSLNLYDALNKYNIAEKQLHMYIQNYLNETYDNDLIDNKIEQEIYKLDLEKIREVNMNEAYRAIGINSGLFWGMPLACYQVILHIYGQKNILECFATPINHVFENYCSLFAELSSQGNFFDIINDSTFTCYFINPPFTSSIIIKTIHKIHSKLIITNKFIDIHLFLPLWDDIIKYLKVVFKNIIIYKIHNSLAYDFINKKYIKNNIKQVYVFISNETINEKHVFISKQISYHMDKNSYDS